jgi:hypothetical protein
MKPYSAAALAAALVLLAPWAARAQEQAPTRSFKWVDSKGVVHYGDSIPAEFAHEKTTELNRQGIELRQSPAQLSATEAKSLEEREAALARQQQHDQFLLATYTSSREIEQLRDERVALIEGQIIAARGFLAAAEAHMKTLEERAKNFRPYAASPNARRMPDPLAEEIVRTLREERSQREVMQKKQVEKDALRTTFQADIERYDALLARRSASR